MTTQIGSGSSGALGSSGRRRGVAALGVIAAFVLLAVTKPWAGPSGSGGAPQGPTSGPASADGPTTPSIPSSAPTPGPRVSFADAVDQRFTTSAPTAPDVAWREVHWRELSPTDALSYVRGYERGTGAFVAFGASDPSVGGLPLWSSADGTTWSPLPSASLLGGAQDTGSVVAAVPFGNGVAVIANRTGCVVPDCSVPPEPQLEAFSSADGQVWVSHVWNVTTAQFGARLVAAGGPAGLIVTGGAFGGRVFTASVAAPDVLEEAGTPLSADFVPSQLNVFDGRYVAVGLHVADGDSSGDWQPASLHSVDGLDWPKSVTRLPATNASGDPVESFVTSVARGRDGLIAIGHITSWPGGALWWSSADGAAWHALDGFPPLGALGCSALTCAANPAGWLAGDGNRIVAGGVGPGSRAYVSFNGTDWQALAISGDVPDSIPTVATVLPGGVLLSDGVTSWYAEARS